MNAQVTPKNVLEEVEISLNIKISMLWASLMFLVIYLDYFHLYMPGKMEDIQTGRVFEFGITQGFLLAAFTTVTIPIVRVFNKVCQVMIC